MSKCNTVSEREKIFNILLSLEEDKNIKKVYYKGICVEKFLQGVMPAYYKVWDTSFDKFVEIKSKLVVVLLLRKIRFYKKHIDRIKNIAEIKNSRKLENLKLTAVERNVKRKAARINNLKKKSKK